MCGTRFVCVDKIIHTLDASLTTQLVYKQTGLLFNSVSRLHFFCWAKPRMKVNTDTQIYMLGDDKKVKQRRRMLGYYRAIYPMD